MGDAHVEMGINKNYCIYLGLDGEQIEADKKYIHAFGGLQVSFSE